MGVRKRISRRSESFILTVGILVIAAVVGFGATLGYFKLKDPNFGSTNTTSSADDATNELEEIDESNDDISAEEPEVLAVDFQPVIDNWIKTVGGNKSVLIYDLNLDEIVGSYNTGENYNTASLYKLFVVYEGYKRVQSGVWNGEARAGSTGYTINKCLDLAIRESYSPCAETLWTMIGYSTLDNIISKEWKITNSNISKLISNPNDIMLIMKRFYEHPDFDNETLLALMWDSFLNQPATDYEWRQGLPSGFSKAEVYDKVGWAYNADGRYWDIYHDAAIVKFPIEDKKTRDYIVVVMTNKVDCKNIRKLGGELENKFYEEIKI